MQELRGEEEPGGEGPRGPHEGDIKGESGPRGPHREHLNHETLTSAGLDVSQFQPDSGDVQESPRSLGPVALQHPEQCPMGPRDPLTCVRPVEVGPVDAEHRDAVEEEDNEHQQAEPGHLTTTYTFKPRFPTDPLLRPLLSVQASLYPAQAQPYDHSAREAAFLPPGMTPSCVHLFPPEPADDEFPLMLDPISSLGLHDDQDGEEAAMELPGSGSPSPEPGGDLFGGMAADHLLVHEVRRRGVNMTEGVPVPSSEHVAEIVGRQGCKIKALRAKTNTYIKTPVRGEEPIFIVTGRKEDVEMAKREILAAAEHFSIIRATRNKMNGIAGAAQGPPNLPGQTTIQVRVPYRVVGLVVGPKGATIKRIQQNTHTYIVTPSRDKEPIFEVTGMPENVDRAREEIEAHITMRTGSIVDNHPDSDFHSNGTDVCMDMLVGGNIWSKQQITCHSSGGSRTESLGSSVESPYYGSSCREQSPASPCRSVVGRSFALGGKTLGSQHTVGIEDCEFGLEYLALDSNTSTAVWSSFETSNGHLQTLSGCHTQRRNSVFSGSSTPLLSPSLPDHGIGLEHPLARRIHSDPVGSISWLPSKESLSSFSNSAGYSSSSSLPGSSSVASGSPTESNSSDGQRKSVRDCVVCFESEVIAALVPCGHNLFCMECAIRICERQLPECPACHAPATQAIRIFS
ncbi:RNA-binding protein MEX3B-like [Lithobates pipiens]